MTVEFKREDWFYFGVFLIIFLTLFHSFFFKAETFYERDSTLLETPVRMHAVQLLKEGNFALWTDSHGNGQPFLANPKIAIFYPTTLVYLFFPFFVAFRIHYLIHPIIGWLGMYLLGKSYGFSRKASFLSSSLFFFSGMYLSSFEFYNHIAAIAWMMWALYLQRLNRPIKSSVFLLYILTWVLLILSGAPEFIIITGILALGQAFFDYKHFKDHILKLGLAVLLACLITAAQLLPSFEMLTQTERLSGTELWPLELIQLPEMIFPHILGNDRQPGHNDFWGGHLFDRGYPLYYSLYIGFGALILFFLALFYWKDKKIKIWGVMVILFFLMSCGKYSPLFIIYQNVPFISSIRYPVKFFIGTIFLLCLMAGFSLDKLKESPPHDTFKKNFTVISVFFLFMYLLFKVYIIQALSQLFVIDKPSLEDQLSNSILFGIIIFVVYAIVFNLLVRIKKRRDFLLTILLILCLLDPIYHNRCINPTVDEAYFSPPSILNEINTPTMIYRDDMPPFVKPKEEIEKFRIISFYWQSLFPFSALPYNVNYVLNNDFMDTYPIYQKRIMKRIKSLNLDGRLKILRYVGCQYHVGNHPMFFPESARKIVVEGYNLYIEKISDKPAKPIVVFKTIQADGLDQKLKIFISPDFDPQTEVLVDKTIKIPETIIREGKLIKAAGVKDNFVIGNYFVDVMEEKSGFGRYRTNLDKDGIVVFPFNWAKGWKAWIDGKKSAVFEANLFSKGIMVPAGEHEIILKYCPDSFIVGSVLSLISLLGILILWTFFIFRRKVGRGYLE
ncbi:MAG: YfhO family protein [Candidatus Aminicenantes bacterium]|nr:YfhO family protein [Candidatus Aminicenantes bacterium]